MEITLSLTFACCYCYLSITVDLKCKGIDANTTQGQLAAVNVPCPQCQQVNQLIFETTGIIRDVRSFAPAQPVPEPSLN